MRAEENDDDLDGLEHGKGDGFGYAYLHHRRQDSIAPDNDLRDANDSADEEYHDAEEAPGATEDGDDVFYDACDFPDDYPTSDSARSALSCLRDVAAAALGTVDQILDHALDQATNAAALQTVASMVDSDDAQRLVLLRGLHCLADTLRKGQWKQALSQLPGLLLIYGTLVPPHASQWLTAQLYDFTPKWGLSALEHVDNYRETTERYIHPWAAQLMLLQAIRLIVRQVFGFQKQQHALTTLLLNVHDGIVRYGTGLHRLFQTLPLPDSGGKKRWREEKKSEKIEVKRNADIEEARKFQRQYAAQAHASDGRQSSTTNTHEQAGTASSDPVVTPPGQPQHHPAVTSGVARSTTAPALLPAIGSAIHSIANTTEKMLATAAHASNYLFDAGKHLISGFWPFQTDAPQEKTPANLLNSVTHPREKRSDPASPSFHYEVSPLPDHNFSSLSEEAKARLIAQIKKDFEGVELPGFSSILHVVWEEVLATSPSIDKEFWPHISSRAYHLQTTYNRLNLWFSQRRTYVPRQDVLLRACLRYPKMPASEADFQRIHDLVLYLQDELSHDIRKEMVQGWYSNLNKPELHGNSWNQTFAEFNFPEDAANWLPIAFRAQETDRENAFHQQIFRENLASTSSDADALADLESAIGEVYDLLYPDDSTPGYMSAATRDLDITVEALGLMSSAAYMGITRDEWLAAARSFQTSGHTPGNMREIAALAIEKRTNSPASLNNTTASDGPVRKTRAATCREFESMEYSAVANRFLEQYPYRGGTQEQADAYRISVMDSIYSNPNPDYHRITLEAWTTAVANTRRRHVKGSPLPDVIDFLNEALQLSHDGDNSNAGDDSVSKIPIDTSLRIKPISEYTAIDILDIFSSVMEDPFGEATRLPALLSGADPETARELREAGGWVSRTMKVILSLSGSRVPAAMDAIKHAANALKDDLLKKPLSRETALDFANDVQNLYATLRPHPGHPLVGEGKGEKGKPLPENKIPGEQNEHGLPDQQDGQAPNPPAEKPSGHDEPAAAPQPPVLSEKWTSEQSLEGIEPDANGMFSIGNRKFIQAKGKVYEIEFSQHTQAWMLVRQDGRQSYLYAATKNAQSNWQIEIAGLHGGGKDELAVPSAGEDSSYRISRPISRLERELAIVRRKLGLGESIKSYNVAKGEFQPSKDFDFIDVQEPSGEQINKMFAHGFHEGTLEVAVNRIKDSYGNLLVLLKSIPPGSLDAELTDALTNIAHGASVSKQMSEDLQGIKSTGGPYRQLDQHHYIDNHFSALVDTRLPDVPPGSTVLRDSASRAKAILHTEFSSEKGVSKAIIKNIVAEPFTQLSDKQFARISSIADDLKAQLDGGNDFRTGIKKILKEEDISEESFSAFLKEFPREGGQKDRIKNVAKYMIEKQLNLRHGTNPNPLTLFTTPINVRTAQSAMQKGFSVSLAGMELDDANNLYEIAGKQYAEISGKVYLLRKNARTGTFEAFNPNTASSGAYRPVHLNARKQWNFGVAASTTKTAHHISTRSVRSTARVQDPTGRPHTIIYPRPMPKTLFHASRHGPTFFAEHGGIDVNASIINGYDEESWVPEAHKRNAKIFRDISRHNILSKNVFANQRSYWAKRLINGTPNVPKLPEKTQDYFRSNVAKYSEKIRRLDRKKVTVWTPFHVYLESAVENYVSSHHKKNQYKDPLQSAFIELYSAKEKAQHMTENSSGNLGYVYEIMSSPNFIDAKFAETGEDSVENSVEWLTSGKIPWNCVVGWWDPSGAYQSKASSDVQ